METTPATPATTRAVRWAAVVSGVFCLAGIAVAAYLTDAHYTSAKVLACSDRGLVNCARVTTSSYSRILGVPVADLGLAYFLAMAGLCSPWARRSDNRLLRRLRVLGAVSGVGMVIWLVYAELLRLDAIGLYCTTIHAITVALFVTVALGTAATGLTVADKTDDTDLAETIDGVTRNRSHSLRKDRAGIPLRP